MVLRPFVSGMTRDPTRVLLFAQEPCQATYLEAVLEIEAPGMFQVCRCGNGIPPPPATDSRGYDLFILAIDGGTCVGDDVQPGFPLDPTSIPTIVVSPWIPDSNETRRLMRSGAEDVLGLGELNPRRLVAAITKAMERRARPGRWPRKVSQWRVIRPEARAQSLSPPVDPSAPPLPVVGTEAAGVAASGWAAAETYG
jgi:hypothetical protein